MKLRLRDVARAIGSSSGAPPGEASGWSVDSRTVGPGDLFFALRGANNDGHRFIPQAFERGAVAAVADHSFEAGGRLLVVKDTLEALQALAGWARKQWAGKMVAITGSAGKTTTKDITATLLGVRYRVGKTEGNLNNHVGLPLSLLRLPEDTDVAVIELGMNHAGEIRSLAAIAKPETGVVTNVGYAHVEAFDSIDGVALAKRELIDSLPRDGVAVLNADDARVARFADVHPGTVVTFGFSEGATVRATQFEGSDSGTRFEVAGEGWFETGLEGRHAVMNVLAALAVARVFGLAPGETRAAVAGLTASAMRGRRLTHEGITIIDDCYNANPEAVRAMLETLRGTPARRRIAVLGEMLELGQWSEALHQELGRDIAACGVNVLVGIRGAARRMVDAAVGAGLPDSAAYFFPEPEEAGDHLAKIVREGDAILFKGSRGTHVERALERAFTRSTPWEEAPGSNQLSGAPGASRKTAGERL